MPDVFVAHSSMFLRAPATERPDVFVKVLFPVIIRKFFSFLYIFNGININVPALYLWLAVGTARMIDIPRNIRAHCAVDRLPLIHLKKIFTAARIRLGARYRPTDVFDNAFPFFERARCKQSQSST